MLNNGDQKRYMSIHAAARKLGVSSQILLYHVDNGLIEYVDGMIPESVCATIQKQQNDYIGIRSFMKKYSKGRFDARYVKNREKFIEFFMDNFYFDIKRIEPEDILFELPEREDFYIAKEDINLLRYKSEAFFREFGLSEYEKVIEIINKEEKKQSLKTKYLKMYIGIKKREKGFYTPAFTEFVKIVYELNDLGRIEDDVKDVFAEMETIKAKEFLADFLNFVSRYMRVKYGYIQLECKESSEIPAYSYKELVNLAKIFFNMDYDIAHGLTRKALENHKYAEMWLFFSCFYVCGWRGKDIANRWLYPYLESDDNPFGITIDTLKSDILNEAISDYTYEKVAMYSINRIDMSYAIPEKNGYGKLRSAICPELRAFFGKLILIAEYHHITSGEGYMLEHRTKTYGNWVQCKEFFGEEILEIIGRRSLSPRRLNKSYLQGLEIVVREQGNTSMIAHVVAAYARNHSDCDTTLIYLKDHGLTGETAEVVLYTIIQRGVFGSFLYGTLLEAFPDLFNKLPLKAQTELMENLSISAYELEVFGVMYEKLSEMEDMFSAGKQNEVLEVLFSIALGRGKAKDAETYCMRRALGYSCEHPAYESCIANLCPYHVFTRNGLPALLKVIQEYIIKEKDNLKYYVVLHKKILPAFSEILKMLMNEMTDKEKESVMMLIEENMNE